MHYGKIEPLNDREAASATGQQIEVLYASAGREIEIATRSKGAAGGRHFLLAFTSKDLPRVVFFRLHRMSDWGERQFTTSRQRNCQSLEDSSLEEQTSL